MKNFPFSGQHFDSGECRKSRVPHSHGRTHLGSAVSRLPAAFQLSHGHDNHLLELHLWRSPQRDGRQNKTRQKTHTTHHKCYTQSRNSTLFPEALNLFLLSFVHANLRDRAAWTRHPRAAGDRAGGEGPAAPAASL